MAPKLKRLTSKGGVTKPTKSSPRKERADRRAAARTAAETARSEKRADERVPTTSQTTSSTYTDASVQTTSVNYRDASTQTEDGRVEAAGESVHTTAGITVPLDGYRPDLNPQRVSLAEEFRGTVPDEDLSLFVELWMGFNDIGVRADSPFDEA
jgi:hypothetical protein